MAILPYSSTMSRQRASKEDAKQGSGNVFADLGLENDGELSVKARLVLNLKRIMDLHGLTQKAVAARVGADQPTISKVLRGRLDLVTTDRLLTWLSRLDQEVQITVRDCFGQAGKGDAPGGVQVFAG